MPAKMVIDIYVTRSGKEIAVLSRHEKKIVKTFAAEETHLNSGCYGRDPGRIRKSAVTKAAHKVDGD
ncbi:MAG: hypothetical protein K5694_06530 [Bacilli bacterium]|nr:hypothetical protein [Bacilli bacterium]